MASMRVHELAKELNMSSKELLDCLAEMKIPAKSHASVLADAYVTKIRKNLEPEIKAQAGIIEDEEAKKLAEEKAQAEAKKAEEEAARRAAVEHERALREAERAQRQGAAEPFNGSADGSGAAPAAKKPSSPYAGKRARRAREGRGEAACPRRRRRKGSREEAGRRRTAAGFARFEILEVHDARNGTRKGA
jgi:translation initiation factor IF-2